MIAVGRAAEADFDALFHGHYPRVCRAIYRVVGNTDFARELATEAFWRFYQKPPRELTNADAWLCRTGVRLALDWLRKEKRRRHYESAAPVPARPPGPEEQTEREEERRRVRVALTAIKPKRAELLLLRAEGLSYAELAAALDINPASIGTILARAENSFRKEYERLYGTL
jgi:RNA polymerase sigma-70 factor (ECF subfamily)